MAFYKPLTRVQKLKKPYYVRPEVCQTNIAAQLGQYNLKSSIKTEVSQEFPFPTVFKARRELMAQDVKLAESNVLLTRNELAFSLANRYNNLVYAYALEEKLKRLDSLYAEFERASQVKFQAGDIAQIQVTTAKTKRGEAQLQWQQQQVLIANLQNQLMALSQLQSLPSLSAANLQVEELTAQHWMADSLQNPEILQLKQQLERANAEIKLEKQQRLPDFIVGYANTSFIGQKMKDGQVVNHLTSRDRFHSATVGIAVPIFNSGANARIKSYKLEQEANTLRLQQRSAELQTEWNNLGQHYAQQLKQVRFYQSQGLQNAHDILYAAKLGYEVGIWTISNTSAIQTAINLEPNYIESIYQLNQTVNQMRYILGR